MKINNIKTTSDSSALYINKVNNGEKIVNFGFVVNSPKLNTIGYEINPTNQSMIFENDICIVNTGKNYKNAISVFTKNTQGVSSKVEMTIEKVDSLGNHNVETMVNGNSGAIVEYVILDSNGNDAIANKEVEIYDNVVVNNVAHAKIKVNYQYQYTITSKVNNMLSNSVVVNAKRTLLGLGNATLTLKKNSVSDTSGNKNSAGVIQNISVKLK